MEDLSEVALRQRILKNMSDLSLETTLFNQKLSMPVALAPVGLCGMYARRGEVQAAKAADAAWHSVYSLDGFRLPDRRSRSGYQAPNVVPALCTARSRLYA